MCAATCLLLVVPPRRSLPAEWKLPDGLESLELWSNALAGPLPSGWPAALRFLQLGDNSLTGTPADWALPDSLTDLGLSGRFAQRYGWACRIFGPLR